MDFVGLLSVLAITHTVVLARPADMDLNTKGMEVGSKQFIFPTELAHGSSITIKGRWPATYEEFMVSFIDTSDNEVKKHWKISYNSRTQILWTENGETFYNVGNTSELQDIEFTIKINILTDGNTQRFQILFEGNKNGEVPLEEFVVNNFQDYKYIELPDVIDVTSLLFEYGKDI